MIASGLAFVSLMACGEPPHDSISSLSATANVVVLQERPTRFQTDAVITNESQDSVRLIENCGKELRVMSVRDSLGPPVWTSVNPKAECPGASIANLAAGEQTVYQFEASALEILRSSEQNGIYRVEVVIPIDGRSIIVNAGRISLLR